jgi:SAM-dependent methyltransferase
MSRVKTPIREAEYAERGEYHRNLDPTWEYRPTYLAKLEMVRGYLDRLPRGARVLDAGCGEGVLIEAYADRLDIRGVDLHYASERVTHGSVLDLPFDADGFDWALCLDVLEHLQPSDQPRALAELHRVLGPGGRLLVSIPNLAHLQSRVHFLLRGDLIRTASLRKHPGDRPVNEFIRLTRDAGFRLTEHRGIFPTVPILTRFIRRHPARLEWLHRWLTRLLPVPGWCFLNILVLQKPGSPD